MDILVTVDRNYLHPLAVMLKSLALHHRGTPVRVFILHRSLLPQDFEVLDRAVAEPGLELVSLPAGDSLLAGAPTTNRYPLEMYDRIFAAAKLSPRAELDLNWVWENSRIIHYCGRNKPWKDNYLGQLDQFYHNYAGMLGPM